MRVPFNEVDEAVHLLDTEVEPWSIQLEARLPGELDEARLRSSVGEALARHPMARARKVPAEPDEHSLHWEITPEPDLDPLRVVECADGAALEKAREELLSMAVPLAESPPLRIRLARVPGGDVLMLNVNHAASDGFGCMRILQSIARAYAGDPDPEPDVEFREARDLPRAVEAPDLATRAKRLATLGEKMRDLASTPARLAPEQGGDRPGFGFHHVQLSEEKTKALVGLEHPGTVNDVLVAALTLAIADWNAEHDAPCGRIGVMVPMNVRPKEWRQEMVGNFLLPIRVSTKEQDRATPASTLQAITAQTSEIKEEGTGPALIEVLGGAPVLPLWAKRATSPMLRVTGNRLVDTSLLSNLGAFDEPLSFGPAGKITELWFSAPARMPLGLTVGALTLAGRMHLAFRYRHPQFGPEAARRFADRYVAVLDRFLPPEG